MPDLGNLTKHFQLFSDSFNLHDCTFVSLLYIGGSSKYLSYLLDTSVYSVWFWCFTVVSFPWSPFSLEANNDVMNILFPLLFLGLQRALFSAAIALPFGKFTLHLNPSNFYVRKTVLGVKFDTRVGVTRNILRVEVALRTTRKTKDSV